MEKSFNWQRNTTGQRYRPCTVWTPADVAPRLMSAPQNIKSRSFSSVPRVFAIAVVGRNVWRSAPVGSQCLDVGRDRGSTSNVGVRPPTWLSAPTSTTRMFGSIGCQDFDGRRRRTLQVKGRLIRVVTAAHDAPQSITATLDASLRAECQTSVCCPL